MIKRVTLENGDVYNFPDEASNDQIKSYLNKKLSTSTKSASQMPKQMGNAERYTKDILASAGQFGSGLIKNMRSPLQMPEQARGEVSNLLPKGFGGNYSEMLGIPEEEKTITDRVLQALFPMGFQLATPAAELGVAGKAISKIPYVGRAAKEAVSMAIPQGLVASMQSDDKLKTGAEAGAATVPFSLLTTMATSTDPRLKMLGRAGLAAAGGVAGYEGSKALGAESSLATTASSIVAALAAALTGKLGGTPRDKVLAGANEKLTPQQLEKLEASRRLEEPYMTIAEVTSNPFLAAKQGKIGKSAKGAELLHEKSQERQLNQNRSIKKLINTIYDEDKMKPQEKLFYKKAYETNIPEKEVAKLDSDVVLQDAEQKMLSKPAYKKRLKGVTKNSLAYWDTVKRALDDMIEGAPDKESKELRASKEELLGILDKYSPVDYPTARSYAERRLTLKNKILKKLNKSEYTGTNFFNKVLKNDTKYQELIHSLRAVPEAQEMLADMRLVYKDLIDPQTHKAAAALARTNTSDDRNARASLIRSFQEFITNDKEDLAAVDLLTNPKWEDELKNINKLSDKQLKVKKFLETVSKISAASVGQLNAKED